MLSSNMIISGPAADLGAKEASRPLKKQLSSVQNPGPSTQARAQPLSIKDKISKWEGKKEPPASDPARQTDGQEDYLPSCRVERRGSELTRTKNGMRLETESLQNDSRTRTMCQDAERLPGLRQIDGQPEPSQPRGRELKPSDLRFQSDHLSVLRQVKRLEKALKDGSAGLDPQLPGTCYSPHCLPDKTEEGSGGGGGGREGRGGRFLFSFLKLMPGFPSLSPSPACLNVLRGLGTGLMKGFWGCHLEPLYTFSWPFHSSEISGPGSLTSEW